MREEKSFWIFQYAPFGAYFFEVNKIHIILFQGGYHEYGEV